MTVDEALMCADDDWSNTEGERILAAEVRRLRAENAMLTEQLAQEKEKSEYHKRKSQENYDACVESGEQLAQERKRLDSLRDSAGYMLELIDKAGIHNLASGVQLGAISWAVKMTDARDAVRATIDELIAAEAAGGGN